MQDGQVNGERNEAGTKEFHAGPPVHLAFEQFESVDSVLPTSLRELRFSRAYSLP